MKYATISSVIAEMVKNDQMAFFGHDTFYRGMWKGMKQS
jgi:hypothetical protein